MVNPSLPPHPLQPPRPLDDRELATLLAAADTLIPRVAGRPCASEAPAYLTWLERALAARSESFGDVERALAALDGVARRELVGALKELQRNDPRGFHTLTAVIAGAYLLVPEVRAQIGYPGQERRPAPFDEAAEQILGSGLLAPVIERGPIYVDPATGRVSGLPR